MGRLPGELVVSSLEAFRKKLAIHFSHATHGCFKMRCELLVFAPFLYLCFANSACLDNRQ